MTVLDACIVLRMVLTVRRAADAGVSHSRIVCSVNARRRTSPESESCSPC